MELKTYNRLLESQYSSLASWAVWSLPENQITSEINNMRDFDPENTEKLLRVLNPHFNFVGLNVSRTDSDRKDGYQGPWANFHSDSPKQKDYKLRHALTDTKAWGCYLTDIIKNYPEVNSNNVCKILKENPSMEEECIKMFREELSLLGDTDPTIIALGNVTFEILIRNLGGEYRITKVPHYSNYVNIEVYRNQVNTVLRRCK